MIQINEAIKENIKDLEKAPLGRDEIPGLPTGFKSTDRMMQGFQPGQLIIIGARPGMGKTALALSWASKVAKQDLRSVAYFSYEAKYGELSMRMLSSEARIDKRKLKLKNFDTNELKAIATAVKTLTDMRFFIEDSGIVKIADIKDKCIKLKTEQGLALVVIDYFQLIPHSKNELEEVVNGLKELAVNLEVTVIVLSQLSRPKKRPDRRPLVKDLRNMGSLANLADIICFIYREDYYDASSTKRGIAELIFPKNREGEPGTLELRWIGAQMRYEEFS
jgi:replicative DNA helicase